MKKLVSLFVMLVLFASMSFAQNTSTVAQNGPDNSATVSQTGSLNVSSVQQLSSAFFPRGMEATVTQIGTDNQSTVNMREFGEQFSTVYQNGTGNVANVLHLRNSNTSKVTQYGTDNLADVRIHAGGSYGQVDQYTANNIATIDIGVDGTPMGSGNSFVVVQTTGNDNVSHQTMTASGFTFIDNNNYGDIRVYGAKNNTTQTIGLDPAGGLVSSNGELIYIWGDENTISQTQLGRGNFSKAYVGTDGVANSLFSSNNSVTTMQKGDGHSSSVIILGSGNVASVTQSY